MDRRLVRLAMVLLAVMLAAPVAAGPGRAAPPFTLELFDGRTLSLAELKGKAVLLLFWAQW